MFRNPRFLILSLLLATLCSPALAQQESPAPTDDDDPSVLERLIYVPYRKLKEVFDNQDGSVVLPYKEYLRMLEAAARPRAGQPLSAVMTRAEYRATVEGDIARIQLDLTVLVKGDPWVRVPVAFGEAAIGNVTADRGQVLLQGTGNGTYALLFPEAGETKVTLELVARVRTSPQGRTLALTTPRVGITTFELTIPKSDQTVTLTPKQAIETLPPEGEQTRVKANVGSTAQIVAGWTPRASARPQMDLLTSVTNELTVRVDEGLIHRTAKMKFEVLRGEMSELSFVVPTSDRLLDVMSPGNQVRRWTTEKQANRQVVKVQLLAPTEADVVLEVHTEQTLPDGDIRIGGVAADGTVHGIHALQVVRESGQLSITSSNELAVSIVRQARVTRSAQSGNNVAWRFYGSDMDVAVSAEKIQPRLTARQYSIYSIRDDNELTLNSSFAYQIDRAGVFELRIRVPDGLTVDNVQGDGVTDFNINGNVLTVTLADRKLGTQTLAIRAHQSFDEANNAPQPLPFLSAEGVTRETGEVVIVAPPAIEVITDETSVSGLFPADATGRPPAGIPGRTVSQWSYNRTPVAMSASLRRKPPRLTAFADTTIDVQPKVATVTTRLQFNVENAGVDTFRVGVPEAFADTVRITSPADIKQRTRADDAEDGWVTWTVVLQKKVQGQAILNLNYDLTGPEDAGDDDDGPIESTVQPIRVLAAGTDGDIEPVQVRGEVSVSKDQSLSVTASTTGDDIETIDVRELSRAATDASLAYRYFTQDTSVAITAVKYAIQPVVETVVSRAGVEVVLGHDATATLLCRYRITSSERQRLRIDLPANSELLDQLANGSRISLTPIEATGNSDWDGFYANFGTVVTGGEGSRTFTLTLQFRMAVTDGTEPFDGYRGNQKLLLPRIGGQNENVVVQQQRTVLWVPRDYALVGHPEGYVREHESEFSSSWPVRLERASGHEDLDHWLGDDNTGGIDFPREGHSYVYTAQGARSDITVHWWHMPFSVWVISISVFLIGLVLRKTPIENKLTVVLITAFAAALYALADQETVVQSVYAGSYGIIGVAALWLISGLATRKPGEKPSTVEPTADTSDDTQPPSNAPPAPTGTIQAPPTPPDDAANGAENGGGEDA